MYYLHPGILQLIKNCQPKNVVLVHGEDRKMSFLIDKITDQFSIPSFKPANGEQITIPCQPEVSALMSKETFKAVRNRYVTMWVSHVVL